MAVDLAGIADLMEDADGIGRVDRVHLSVLAAGSAARHGVHAAFAAGNLDIEAPREAGLRISRLSFRDDHALHEPSPQTGLIHQTCCGWTSHHQLTIFQRSFADRELVKGIRKLVR